MTFGARTSAGTEAGSLQGTRGSSPARSGLPLPLRRLASGRGRARQPFRAPDWPGLEPPVPRESQGLEPISPPAKCPLGVLGRSVRRSVASGKQLRPQCAGDARVRDSCGRGGSVDRSSWEVGKGGQTWGGVYSEVGVCGIKSPMSPDPYCAVRLKHWQRTRDHPVGKVFLL